MIELAPDLVAPGEPLVVMVSGGRDSVCLLDCAVAAGAAVTALHVEYGLRPEAAGDERHCAALCERLGVELVVERPRWDGRGNLQAWARDVRYAAAHRLDGPVATGHTATDQAETVLYRLAASPGRRALLGMAPREGRVIRPLLAHTREETAAHCRERGLAWRDDATNGDPRFARTRVRDGLVAELRRVHPAAEANVVRTAELLREEAEVLDGVVATALAGHDRIGLDHLAALPPALARLIVRRLAEDAAGGLCARAANRLDDILALGDGASPSDKVSGKPPLRGLDLGDGVRAVVEEGMLRMVPTPPLPARAPR